MKQDIWLKIREVPSSSQIVAVPGILPEPIRCTSLTLGAWDLMEDMKHKQLLEIPGRKHYQGGIGCSEGD